MQIADRPSPGVAERPPSVRLEALMIPGHRYASVDALRGLAALLVVVLHGSELFAALPALAGRGRVWHDVASAVDLGRVGVVAFFLISGFVIPATLRGPTGRGLVRFGIRRFFRLYPAFWLSIPLGYYAIWTLFSRPYTGADVLANATMLPSLLGHEMAIGLYWTLETELVFYVLCCALFAAGVLHKPKALLAVQMLLIAAAAAMRFDMLPRAALAQWTLMPYSLTVMLTGALCRHAFDARHAPERWEHAWPLAATSLVLGIAPTIAMGLFGRAPHSATASIAGLLAFALFVVTIAWVRRPPAVVVWLGTISYSLYLLHPVPLYVVVHALQGRTVPAPLGVGSLLLFGAVAAVALAAASYYAVELPAIRMARRLTGERPRTRRAAIS
jgi:peptidoglycan/LPS O-acetylase OafA/YrhL